MNTYRLKQGLKSFLISSHISALARPFNHYLGHILMFHRVVSPDGRPRLPNNQIIEVSPDYLRRVISFYRQRSYDFISMDEMLERLTGKQSARKFVTFTFDDGYADNLTTALPLFKEENIPFCVYITTNFPDGKAILWWYLLEEAILKNDRMDFVLDNTPYTISCQSPAEKFAAFKSIRRLLISSGKNMSSALQSIFEPSGMDLLEPTRRLALNWEQVKVLGSDPLVTIGAHTRSHTSLKSLPEQQALDEMKSSRDLIAAKTGLQINHFAYPYGTWKEVGQREASMADTLGFRSAVMTEMGNINLQHRNKRMLLPRININQADNLLTLMLASDGFLPQLFLRF
jgi:peptidoglycan/xylan/chitin deacetylase (PgdA/CDA1 family)